MTLPQLAVLQSLLSLVRQVQALQSLVIIIIIVIVIIIIVIIIIIIVIVIVIAIVNVIVIVIAIAIITITITLSPSSKFRYTFSAHARHAPDKRSLCSSSVCSTWAVGNSTGSLTRWLTSGCGLHG